MSQIKNTVNFYGLNSLKLEDFILQKTLFYLEEKTQLMIKCNSAQMDILNRIFSTYKVFIPYGCNTEPNAHMQPILLNTSNENFNEATDIILCPNTYDKTTNPHTEEFKKIILEFFKHANNILLIFDLHCEEMTAYTREVWTLLKKEDCKINYTEV